MQKQRETKRTSLVRRFPRLVATGILMIAAFLTIGVVAGISKQRSRALDPKLVEESAPMANPPRTNVTAPQQANQTAQIRPLTQAEAERLATALKQLANQST